MSDAPHNPPRRAAKGNEGDSPTLTDLYDTLGSVHAGLDVRRQEGEEDKAKLLDEERDLLEQRQQAEKDGDAERYRELTTQLERDREAWLVMTSEAEDEESPDAGTDQHAQPERDGDPRGPNGDEPEVATD